MEIKIKEEVNLQEILDMIRRYNVKVSDIKKIVALYIGA